MSKMIALIIFLAAYSAPGVAADLGPVSRGYCESVERTAELAAKAKISGINISSLLSGIPSQGGETVPEITSVAVTAVAYLAPSHVRMYDLRKAAMAICVAFLPPERRRL